MSGAAAKARCESGWHRTPQQAKKLAGCDSVRLYNGERSPASLRPALRLRRARRLRPAHRERAAVLTMLYANGLGVEPNVELAQMFNCEVGGSIEEIAARQSRLEAWAKSDKSREFDICDGAAIGFPKGICDGKAARLGEASKRRRS